MKKVRFLAFTQSHEAGFRWAVALWLLCGGALPAADKGLPVANLERAKEVDFQREILPLLRKNCIACHNQSDAKGDVVLESLASIEAGIDGDPMVEPGSAEESVLFQVTAHRARPPMPPKKNKVGARPLGPDELALLKLWIDQGAGPGSAAPESKPAASWHRSPTRLRSIYAVALSEDEQLVACSRGNRISLYHAESGELETRLVDPGLAATGLYRPEEAAHLDSVQALAFHPDADRLVSGGYRNVKVWRRSIPSPSRRYALPGGTTRVTALAEDDRAVWLAAGTASGELFLWPRRTGGEAVELSSAHGKEVSDLQFTRDGVRLFSASLDGTVGVSSVSAGQLRQVTRVQVGSPVRAIALFDEGSSLASVGDDGFLRLWRLTGETLELDFALRVHDDAVTAVVALPSARCVTASAAGGVRRWDLSRRERLREQQGVASGGEVVLSPEGTHLATVDSAQQVTLWSLAGEPAERKLSGSASRARVLARGRRAVRLAQARLEEARQELVRAGEETKTQSQNLEKARNDASEATEKLVTKRKAVVEASRAREEAEKKVDELKELLAQLDEGVVLADAELADASAGKAGAETGQREADLGSLEEARVRAKVAAKNLDELQAKEKKARDEELDGELTIERANASALAAETALATAKRVEEEAKGRPSVAENALRSLEEALREAEALVAEPVVEALAFSPDADVLAAATETGELRLWLDGEGPLELLPRLSRPMGAALLLSSGEVIAQDGGELQARSLELSWELERVLGDVDAPDVFADRVTALRFTPDGRFLASGGGDPSRRGQLKLWRVSDWSVVWTAPQAHTDTVSALDFTWDGTRLVSCGADKLVKVWNPEDGTAIRSFEGHTGHVLGVAWRYDGRVLASASADGSIKVWEAETGRQLRTIEVSGKGVTAVRFVGDTSHLISTCEDGMVRRHNSEDGEKVRDYSGAADFLYALDLAPGGGLVVSGGVDSTLCLWRAEEETPVQVLAPVERRRY